MTEGAGRRILWGLALAWAGLIFHESSQSRPLPFLPDAIFTHDKLLHLGAYAVLGALLAGALARTRVGALPRAAVVAALLVSAYGVSDEWHQSYVPGRTADPWDWAADTLGGAAGATAMLLALRRRDARASIRA